MRYIHILASRNTVSMGPPFPSRLLLTVAGSGSPQAETGCQASPWPLAAVFTKLWRCPARLLHAGKQSVHVVDVCSRGGGSTSDSATWKKASWCLSVLSAGVLGCLGAWVLGIVGRIAVFGSIRRPGAWRLVA